MNNQELLKEIMTALYAREKLEKIEELLILEKTEKIDKSRILKILEEDPLEDIY